MSTSPQLTELNSPLTALVASLIRVAVTDTPAVITNGNSNISVLEVRGFATTTSDFTTINSRQYRPDELRSTIRDINNSSFYNAQSFVAAVPASPVFGSSAAAGAYWTYDAPTQGDPNGLSSHHIVGDTPNVALQAQGSLNTIMLGALRLQIITVAPEPLPEAIC